MRSKITDDLAVRMREEYEGGDSLRAVADRHGFASHQTVSDAIRRAGGAIRARGVVSRKPEEPRNPCRCGCGRLVSRPGNIWIVGHHRRAKRSERVSQAAEVELRAGGTCGYRPPRFTPRSGTDYNPKDPALQAPACGRPTAIEGDFCSEHQSARPDGGGAEGLAIRLRETVTVRCARCGLEWESSAMRASSTFAFHTKVCPAA